MYISKALGQAMLFLAMASAATASPMIVGGYASIPAASQESVSAAKSSVAMKNALPDSRKVRLISIIKAESQVVAGMNFRLCLKVTQGKKAFRVRTVVYRDLSGALTLTEWTPKGC